MANVRLPSKSMVQAIANEESDERIDLTEIDLKLLLVSARIKNNVPVIGSVTMQSDDGLNVTAKHASASTTYGISQSQVSLTQQQVQRLLALLSEQNVSTTPDPSSVVSATTLSSMIVTTSCDNPPNSSPYVLDTDSALTDSSQPISIELSSSSHPLPAPIRRSNRVTKPPTYLGVSKPLLAVQVTELVDGIFIGCTMNHSAGDGTSFWNFFNFWSDISRELDHISKHPVLDRLSLLNELKARANGEVATNSISSLQSLLAHIWISTTRSRQDNLDEEVDLIIFVDIRTRLQPPLPDTYFGSAVVLGTVTMKAREILEHGLGYVALQINKVVSSYTEDKVEGILESFLDNPNPFTISNFVRNNCLIASSSPRFNVFGIEFGFGRPVAVRSARTKSDGKITLFPGKEEGSIDIGLSVFPETLKAMEK
ncbi:unnamed protein product [Dovyalis caffra]|uniref:Uncharacterized protein n=1 Tax=Dovyalis caffra TaxID=77055 RepID=A0AAV1SMK0_9ROSI|nr:unnamed protein product [Dovyalis caffra]